VRSLQPRRWRRSACKSAAALALWLADAVLADRHTRDVLLTALPTVLRADLYAIAALAAAAVVVIGESGSVIGRDSAP
jgi:hypothetical protein